MEWKIVGQLRPDLCEGVAHALLLTSAAKPILLEAAACTQVHWSSTEMTAVP